MVKISMLYPKTADTRFDMDYYLHVHMPMSIDRLSAAKGYRGVTVERGLLGGAPGTDPIYVAMCHYLFDTLEEFLAAFGQHAGTLRADMPHFTDIQPVIQISAVEISR